MMLFAAAAIAADPMPSTHTDESKVPAYTLPDPLTASNGQKVETPQQWTAHRRRELLKLFEDNVYGKPVMNNAPVKMQINTLESGDAFNGKATRYQFGLQFYVGDQPKDTDPIVDFLVYVPKTKKDAKPFSMFLGLNFQGNHTTTQDPAVLLRPIWNQNAKKYTAALESQRGAAQRRWVYETIIDRGYAVGTAHYEAFEPDAQDGRQFGVRRLIYNDGDELRPDEANAIGTWAWGLTKLLDTVIEKQEALHVNPLQVAVLGHSRLGKTALWAGAIEPRFAMVISNNSGCGGAALSRRAFGETVARINVVFPHWFCGNFKKYNGNEKDLPVDQHELIALAAPRPVYIASASEDLWADPKGEFLSALYADPVYKLLGADGFGAVQEQPGVNQPVGERIRYHLRSGKHDIVEYDWLQYLDFADKYLR